MAHNCFTLHFFQALMPPAWASCTICSHFRSRCATWMKQKVTVKGILFFRDSFHQVRHLHYRFNSFAQRTARSIQDTSTSFIKYIYRPTSTEKKRSFSRLITAWAVAGCVKDEQKSARQEEKTTTHANITPNNRDTPPPPPIFSIEASACA